MRPNVNLSGASPLGHSYTYGADGNLAGITSSAGTFSYGYDRAGGRTTLTYPNGVEASYGYDDAGQLTSLRHAANGTSVLSLDYTYDKAGNRTSKAGSELETYSYDATYQLLSVTSAKPEKYTYDAVGNRLSGPGYKDTGYQYNAANQMLQGRRFAYTYDKNGNQTSRQLPGVSEKSENSRWDFENRLVRVEKNKGAEKRTVVYGYDPFGRRVAKEATSVVDGVRKTQSFLYIYDGDDISLEISADDTSTTKTFYTHGPRVDEHLALESKGKFSYYHSDAIGSVVAMTGADRSTIAGFSYVAFGFINISKELWDSRFLYTAESGIRRPGCTITVPEIMTRWRSVLSLKTPYHSLVAM